MKSIFKKLILATLLVAMLLPLLASCANAPFSMLSAEKRALRLLGIDVNRIEGLHSYSVKSETEMGGLEKGESWSTTTNELLTVTGLQNLSELCYYRKATSVFSYSDTVAPEETLVMENGYTDGQMFTRRALGAEDPVTLTSPIDGETYLAHLQQTDGAVLSDIVVGEAEKITCQKNDDGEWVVTVTGFSSLGLKRLYHYFEVSEHLVYVTMEKATLTYRTTADFIPLELKLEVEFEEPEKNQAYFHYTRRYENYNATETPHLDLKDAQETKDLRLAEQVAALFREIECASSLSFNKSEKYYLKVDSAESGKQDAFARCEYTVTQTDGEDGVTFRADITEDGESVIYIYANNRLQTENAAGKNPAKTMSDAAARAKVYDWFNTAFFDQCDLTTSELVDNNPRFKFKSIDPNAYAARLKEVGSSVDKIRSSSSMLDVTIKDGKMVAYSYMATLRIYCGSKAYVLYYEVTVDNISYDLSTAE